MLVSRFFVRLTCVIDGNLLGQIAFYKEQSALVPENYILWYLFQIMLGLDHLHAQLILHSDMKPENIFVKETGELKLGDLASCKVLVTTAGQVTTI